jgi:hypothetical protein
MSGSDLVADVSRMRSGAVQLARLTDELASVVARAAALPLPEPGLAARRDQLVGSLGQRVVTLNAIAERIRSDVAALSGVERQAERGFADLGRILDTGADPGPRRR